MAPKPKQSAASLSAATPTAMGGSPPQEALILVSRMASLNFFLMFWNFCWSWTVDADLAGPCLICEHSSHVDKQNVGLVIVAYFCLIQRDPRVCELIASPGDSASWDFLMRVSFMRLAFESLDLEELLSMESRCRLHVWSRVLVIEHGSHMLNHLFEL